PGPFSAWQANGDENVQRQSLRRQGRRPACCSQVPEQHPQEATKEAGWRLASRFSALSILVGFPAFQETWCEVSRACRDPAIDDLRRKERADLNLVGAGPRLTLVLQLSAIKPDELVAGWLRGRELRDFLERQIESKFFLELAPRGVVVAFPGSNMPGRARVPKQ